MGTRADYYIRKNNAMQWLGSTGYDGHPSSIDASVLNAKTARAFRKAVAAMLNNRGDGTTPDYGWPWPWSDSRLTDYSYIYEKGKVMASAWGGSLFDPLSASPDEAGDGQEEMFVHFPDMSVIRNVTYGQRSGLILIGAAITRPRTHKEERR